MTTTNRVFQTFKKISLTFGNLTTQQMLADSSGDTSWDLSDINWTRIVVIGSLDTITGTNIQFSLNTTNKDVAGATTQLAATKANGSTAMASAVLTAANTGAFGFATGRQAADGSAASNIGKRISVMASPTSITVTSGSIDILIQGD